MAVVDNARVVSAAANRIAAISSPADNWVNPLRTSDVCDLKKDTAASPVPSLQLSTFKTDPRVPAARQSVKFIAPLPNKL